MKPYPPEIDQLIARCLTGECSPEDSGRLNDLFVGDPELKADYELSKLLFSGQCEETCSDDNTRNHFDRVSRRLKEEGLM